MLRNRLALIALIAASACVRRRADQHLFPAGPGLLDGRPPQPPGTYRVVGWVLGDQTGKPVPDAWIVVDGTSIVAGIDKFGRYILPDVPANRNTLVVRSIDHETERRVISRKEPQGLVMCPPAGCSLSFTDTLSFWMHQSPIRIGGLPSHGSAAVPSRH